MVALMDLLGRQPFEVLRGNPNIDINKVTADSRAVEVGTAFVAVRGTNFDGHEFANAAADSGAAALVLEDASVLPENCEVAIRVEASRPVLGTMLNALMNHPDHHLQVLAVTGTNGKTTVSHLLRDLWRARGKNCGLLGTIEYDTLDARQSAPLTTPGVEVLLPLLDSVRRGGGSAVAMEASSHALDQCRLGPIEVDIALFTNLTREHLDYHKNSEAYLAAKRRLLEHLSSKDRRKPVGRAVVNFDDEVFRACDWPDGTIRVGHGADCDVRGIEADFRRDGTTLRLEIFSEEVTVESRLLGLFNAYNLLLVAGAAAADGVSAAEFVSLVPLLDPVPGRLEPVELENGPLAIVDYAHTPDGITTALRAAKKLCEGRLILVFGCGGDRDRGKRPMMAKAALELADEVFFTLDNPRTEDPKQIYEDTRPGFAAAPQRVHRVDDRAEAIAAALAVATRDDLVLVAGKGHEDYQQIGDTKYAWDDRAALRDGFRGAS